MRGRLPRSREKGGAATGPSPVDRRKTGSKHHLICDGRGAPLHGITTAANVNDPDPRPGRRHPSRRRTARPPRRLVGSVVRLETGGVAFSD